MQAYETLIIDTHDDGLVVVRMNRPASLNACNDKLWSELSAVLEIFATDRSIRAVIITGEGRAFCVGADLKEASWASETAAESWRRIERHQQHLTRLLLNLPIPIIAAINGYALGGGMEIALACDIRLASHSATLGFPEGKVGSFISGGASLLLPRLVGPSWAKRLLFTGEMILSEQARLIGLVDEIYPDGGLIDSAISLGRTIVKNAPLTVSNVKRAVNSFAFGDLECALAFETSTLLSLYGTLDHQEGIRAFAERREPAFRGA